MEQSKNLSWKEIKEKYPNQWVAIANFSDDPDFPSNSQGNVYAHSADEAELVKILKKKGDDLPLAIEYTGQRLVPNFHGGIWPQPEQ